MMSGFIKYCSLHRKAPRTCLRLRALAVKGVLAFVGYKIGNALFFPFEPQLDNEGKHYAVHLNHISKTQHNLQASASKLQKDLEDLKKFRAAASTRGQKKETKEL